MEVRTFPIGPLQTNCFLLMEGSEALVVDPGGDPAPILSLLKEKKLTLTHIVVTHFHCDHIYGSAALHETTGAPILASPEDASLLDTELGAGGFMGLPLVEPFEYDALNPGETTFLGQPCTVMATPGHSPGSLSLYFPQASAVFVGDLIFYGSIGRTDFPGGSEKTLLESVVNNIFVLPEDTVIYSGHGPETTVGQEKRHNPFF
jgi:hydroxyacylglutathione hydrolase